MASMNEAHFCGIVSQSSIYGLTSLPTSEGSHKVLVASSKRKVYCIEYSKNRIFSTREVQFTYIPGRAEIISIDAFNQACNAHDFVVGITFTRPDSGGKQSQYFFNIYSDWEPSNECDLDNIAQGCLSIGLDFIPFHLTHTKLYINDVKETVWLLSGRDNKIHLFREDKARQTYYEDQSEIYFPEFLNLPSVVMWMDFITSPKVRVTALGCKDGTVLVSKVHFKPETGIKSWKILHDGPISCLQLFKDVGSMDKTSDDMELVAINLLVSNTLEVSVVYRDVLNKGLSLTNQWILPDSNKYDCVTCGLVTDTDMDGQNELLLGTYGQKLLVYKWSVEENSNKGSYSLNHQQMFPYPLLALRYIDIIGDGIKELLVLTTKGLHILQHDLELAMNLCISRMKLISENLSEEKIKQFCSLNTC